MLTVPMEVELNKPYIQLEFRCSNGATRTARCLVDTGGGPFLLSAALARDLRLKLGEEFASGRQRMAGVAPPEARVGDVRLNLDRAQCRVTLEPEVPHPGFEYDCMLPGHVLQRYQVLLDYPNKRFALNPHGVSMPNGAKTATSVHPRSGFPRIEVEVAGERLGFLLDTGASYTMLSAAVARRWKKEHPEWPLRIGAVGAANMGLPWDDRTGIMRVPELRLDSLTVGEVGIVTREAGEFEEWMAPMLTGPIVGALAGNVLRDFRVTVDYASGQTVLERLCASDPHDLDQVALTLCGSRVLAADPAYGDRVRPGDRILQVDGRSVAGWSHPRIVATLHGTPGQIRRLTLERDDREVMVEVPVIRAL